MTSDPTIPVTNTRRALLAATITGVDVPSVQAVAGPARSPRMHALASAVVVVAMMGALFVVPPRVVLAGVPHPEYCEQIT